jgi:hypothetical protein
MNDVAFKTRMSVGATLTLSVVTIGMPSMTHASEQLGPRLVGRMMIAPEQAPARVGLGVDTADLGSGEEPLKAKIEETAAGVFEAEGFEGARDEEDPRIVVVVERTGTEENPGFVVGFSIERGDEIVSGSARQADCSLCTRTELLERIEEEVVGLLELAREHQVVEAVDDGGGDGGEEGGGEDGGGPEVKVIGPLGIAGVGVGVLGLAGVGVGVAFAVRGFEPLDENQLDLKDYRTPGNVVLAIGGAALIAGVVMIAVDVSKRKKSRGKSKSAARVRVEPRGLGVAF